MCLHLYACVHCPACSIYTTLMRANVTFEYSSQHTVLANCTHLVHLFISFNDFCIFLIICLSIELCTSIKMDELLPYRVSYSDGKEGCQKCRHKIGKDYVQIAIMIQVIHCFFKIMEIEYTTIDIWCKKSPIQNVYHCSSNSY